MTWIGLSPAAPDEGGSGVEQMSSRPGLLPEVEVARRLLLEPEAVVLRRVLEELRGLLEHVLVFALALGADGRVLRRHRLVRLGGLVEGGRRLRRWRPGLVAVDRLGRL